MLEFTTGIIVGIIVWQLVCVSVYITSNEDENETALFSGVLFFILFAVTNRMIRDIKKSYINKNHILLELYRETCNKKGNLCDSNDLFENKHPLLFRIRKKDLSKMKIDSKYKCKHNYKENVFYHYYIKVSDKKNIHNYDYINQESDYVQNIIKSHFMD